TTRASRGSSRPSSRSRRSPRATPTPRRQWTSSTSPTRRPSQRRRRSPRRPSIRRSSATARRRSASESKRARDPRGSLARCRFNRGGDAVLLAGRRREVVEHHLAARRQASLPLRGGGCLLPGRNRLVQTGLGSGLHGRVLVAVGPLLHVVVAL